MGAIVKKPGKFSQDLQFSEWLSNVLQVISPQKKENETVNSSSCFMARLTYWASLTEPGVHYTLKYVKWNESICCWTMWKYSLLFCEQLSDWTVLWLFKGFKDSWSTLSVGQGEAHPSQCYSIKEKLWWPFAFSTEKRWDTAWQRALTHSLLNIQGPALNPQGTLNLTHGAAVCVFN